MMCMTHLVYIDSQRENTLHEKIMVVISNCYFYDLVFLFSLLIFGELGINCDAYAVITLPCIHPSS